MSSKNEDSLGISILKGVGKLLVSTAKYVSDPDNLANWQTKADKLAQEGMRSGDPKRMEAAQKIIECSAKNWEWISKMQEQKAKKENMNCRQRKYR